MKSLSPYNLGDFVVERCQKISVNSYIQEANLILKKAILTSKMNNVELTTSKTHFNGIRFWFVCPLCKSRSGTLFVHPINSDIGCRKCFGLKYSKSRYKGMVESTDNISLK